MTGLGAHYPVVRTDPGTIILFSRINVMKPTLRVVKTRDQMGCFTGFILGASLLAQTAGDIQGAAYPVIHAGPGILGANP